MTAWFKVFSELELGDFNPKAKQCKLDCPELTRQKIASAPNEVMFLREVFSTIDWRFEFCGSKTPVVEEDTILVDRALFYGMYKRWCVASGERGHKAKNFHSILSDFGIKPKSNTYRFTKKQLNKLLMKYLEITAPVLTEPWYLEQDQ